MNPSLPMAGQMQYFNNGVPTMPSMPIIPNMANMVYPNLMPNIHVSPNTSPQVPRLSALSEAAKDIKSNEAEEEEGNEKVEKIWVKSPDDSASYVSEVVGDEHSVGRRLCTGQILDFINLLAGRVGVGHVQGPVATVSFDRVDLEKPILHQDLVRLDGRVVHAGSSSVVVRVVAYRHDMQTRAFVRCLSCYVTMVSIDMSTGRPVTDIPKLDCRTEADRLAQAEAVQRLKLSEEWRKMQAKVDEISHFQAALVEDPCNRISRREFLSIKESEVVIRKQYFYRYLPNGFLYSGDVLMWMDQVATFTAKRFTGNNSLITVSMNRIAFKKPITKYHVVELVARVVFVRAFELEVEVTVYCEHIVNANGPDTQDPLDPENRYTFPTKTVRSVTNNAYFTIFNFDDCGFKRPIVVGLRLSDDDQEGLRAYEKAKLRHKFGSEMDPTATLPSLRHHDERKRKRE